MNIHMIAFRAHLDNPEYSPYLKILNHIHKGTPAHTFFFLLDKVTQIPGIRTWISFGRPFLVYHIEHLLRPISYLYLYT